MKGRGKMFFELLDKTTSTASSASAEGDVWQMVITIGIWVLVIGAAYFLFIRPQKKKQQQEEELRNKIEIGDDITTIGGIVGRVIAVRDDDDTFILETGSDKTRMRFKKWAISSVDTADKQPKDNKKSDDADKKSKKKDKKSEQTSEGESLEK